MRNVSCSILCLLIFIDPLASQDLSDFPPECVMLFGDRPEVFRREADLTYTTKVYELTPEQEGWFSMVDNVPSRFWDAWGVLEDADELYLDHNDISFNSKEPINTVDDANLHLRFAYGNKGLYVLFQVTDDDWNPVLSDAANVFWKFDVCDLYLSQFSSAQMYSDPGEHFYNLRYSQLGLGTAQMLVSFGGNEPVDFFYYNVSTQPTKEDPGPNHFMQQNKTSFADAEAQWGIQVEILPPLQGEENVRRQEWLIPWSIIGGVPGTTRRQSGERLGFGGGYNDFDMTQTAVSRLRWRNGSDPWAHCGGLQPDGTYEGRSIDSWGDILFDKKLDELLADNNVQMPEGWTSDQTNMKRYSLPQRSLQSKAAAQLQHFTPGGRMIRGTVRTNKGIVIKRAMVNGKTVSRKRVVVLP